jgi:hypothetical protein
VRLISVNFVCGRPRTFAEIEWVARNYYDSLGDEQKARINDIGAPAGKRPSPEKQATKTECGQSARRFPPTASTRS